MDDDLLAQLDEDTKKRLREGKMTAEELEAIGLDPGLLDPDEGEEDEQEEPEDEVKEEKKADEE